MVKIKLRRKRSSKPRICSCCTVVLLAALILSVLFIFQLTVSSTQSRNHVAGASPVGIDQILKNSKARISKVQLYYTDSDLGHIDSARTTHLDESKSIRLPNDKPSEVEIVLERNGTGPTNVGYVKDFENERNSPLGAEVFDKKVDGFEKVAPTVTESTIKPCSIWKNGRQRTEPHCSDPTAIIFAYNSAWFPRTLCGQEVQPGSVLRVQTKCEGYEVGLSAVSNPPVSGDGMQPIIIKSRRDEISDPMDLESVDCDVSCVQEKDMHGIQRFVQGEQWTISFTDADAFSNGNARLERLEYRESHFFSTQSFKSSVPHTFFSWSKYGQLNTVSIDWLAARNRAVYLVDRSCSTPGSRRHKYFNAISAVAPVDAYGSCGHNVEVPEGTSIETSEGRIEIMKKYRVVLAFDAGTDKDHISPMIWEALASGSVPVVVGAENMQSHLPKGSFVWSGDFSNWDELANHVKKLLEVKSLWESYQVWRNNESIMARFTEKYEFARTSAICRLCRWSYAKKYGLGWNDERQVVSEPIFKRRMCFSEERSVILEPFEETWISSEGEINVEKSSEKCGAFKDDSLLESKGLRIKRMVSMHDGVIDITLHNLLQTSTNESVILKLSFSRIKNIGGAHFKHTHKLVPTSGTSPLSSASMQDSKAKVTVLSDWNTSIASPSKGKIEIAVLDEREVWPEGDVKRLRIVPEDFDTKNEKTTEFFPSAFCRKVIQDFADPVELFYADG